MILRRPPPVFDQEEEAQHRAAIQRWMTAREIPSVPANQPTDTDTGTFDVRMTNPVITLTPTGDCTLNAVGGSAGDLVTFAVTSAGTTSYTVTFGTNFKSTGTLATGTVDAQLFTALFQCLDGTTWAELARTGAM